MLWIVNYLGGFFAYDPSTDRVKVTRAKLGSVSVCLAHYIIHAPKAEVNVAL